MNWMTWTEPTWRARKLKRMSLPVRSMSTSRQIILPIFYERRRRWTMRCVHVAYKRTRWDMYVKCTRGIQPNTLRCVWEVCTLMCMHACVFLVVWIVWLWRAVAAIGILFRTQYCVHLLANAPPTQRDVRVMDNINLMTNTNLALNSHGH